MNTIMNKYLFRTIRITVISVILIVFNGCSDDSDDPQNPISFNMVCTKWGASTSEVMDYMKNYKMNIMENDFICYNGRNKEQTISYQFQDEELLASLILISQDRTSMSELQSLFSQYEYLGEKNGLNIYINKTTNTMATIAQKLKGEIAYYAIGYTELDIETAN